MGIEAQLPGQPDSTKLGQSRMPTSPGQGHSLPTYSALLHCQAGTLMKAGAGSRLTRQGLCGVAVGGRGQFFPWHQPKSEGHIQGSLLSGGTTVAGGEFIWRLWSVSMAGSAFKLLRVPCPGHAGDILGTQGITTSLSLVLGSPLGCLPPSCRASSASRLCVPRSVV